MQWITSAIKMQCPNSKWEWGCSNNKRANQIWLVEFQHWWHGLMTIKWKFVPLALKKCHVPLALLNVHNGAHPGSKVHKHCRSASRGMSEATSLSRHCSPPRMDLPSQKVQPPAIIPPLGTHWITWKHGSQCPLMANGQSPLLHLLEQFTYTVCNGNAHRVSALYCLLEVSGQAPGKCQYIFVLLSEREINFCKTFEVGHQVATLCHLMVLPGGRLMDGW